MLNISSERCSMRKGLTLVETLVVIAIFAVLIGLLVPAVQNARNSALLAHSLNNVRQISTALHNMADTNRGKLPGTVSSESPYRTETLMELLPYIERADLFQRRFFPPPGTESLEYMAMQVPVYLNPLDPSYGQVNTGLFPEVDPSKLSVSSYALNAQFFALRPRLSQITDGTSNTMWLTEHYGWNCNGTSFVFSVSTAQPWKPVQPATFAHPHKAGRPAPGDYCPITTGNPPVTTTLEGRTFQLRPTVEDCDPRLPNASLSRGLQVGLADTSVRVLSPTTSPAVFWAMVTPSAGEVVPD